jgi:hypothetical protein
MKKFLIVLFAAIVLIGCNQKSREMGDEQAGKTLVGWYYYNLMENEINSLPKYLDEDFDKNVSQSDFFNQLKSRTEQYGPVEKAVLKDWKMVDTDKKQKIKKYEFTYDVKYEKGSSAVEKFYLIKRGDDLKIAKVEF